MTSGRRRAFECLSFLLLPGDEARRLHLMRALKDGVLFIPGNSGRKGRAKTN